MSGQQGLGGDGTVHGLGPHGHGPQGHGHPQAHSQASLQASALQASLASGNLAGSGGHGAMFALPLAAPSLSGQTQPQPSAGLAHHLQAHSHGQNPHAHVHGSHTGPGSVALGAKGGPMSLGPGTLPLAHTQLPPGSSVPLAPGQAPSSHLAQGALPQGQPTATPSHGPAQAHPHHQLSAGVGVGQLVMRLAQYNEFQLAKPPNPPTTALGGTIGGLGLQAPSVKPTPGLPAPSSSTDGSTKRGEGAGEGTGDEAMPVDAQASADSATPGLSSGRSTPGPADPTSVPERSGATPTPSQFHSDTTTDFWRGFVTEFFCEGASYRYIVQHRVFEVGAESLPRLFEATYSGGITNQAIEVLEPREYLIDARTFVLTSRTARMRLESADQITEIYGNLKIVFISQPQGPTLRQLSSLKILLWEFEKHGQREFVSTTLPPDRPRLATNDFGLPAVMRCFEIADIFQCMGDLMRYSIDNACPPLESLRRYTEASRLRAGTTAQAQPRTTPSNGTTKSQSERMEVVANGE